MIRGGRVREVDRIKGAAARCSLGRGRRRHPGARLDLQRGPHRVGHEGAAGETLASVSGPEPRFVPAEIKLCATGSLSADKTDASRVLK